MHIRATSTIESWSSPTNPQRKEKKINKNYLHGKAPNKKKEEWEIFLGFPFLITTAKK